MVRVKRRKGELKGTELGGRKWEGESEGVRR